MIQPFVAMANTEDWSQVGELATAAALSIAIGVERQIRQKSAGLRTHTLVGIGAALFVLVSKYGFSDVVKPGSVVLDPSRVAAQIVSGIGFLGAGIIFVRRDAVRGLTTAAAVSLTAGIGAAAGAGLPILATLATGTYFLVVVGFPPLAARLPRSSTAISVIRVRYYDGRGVLRRVLACTTGEGFAVAEVAATSLRDALGPDTHSSMAELAGNAAMVEVTLRIHGKGSVNELTAALTELDGVATVVAGDINQAGD